MNTQALDMATDSPPSYAATVASCAPPQIHTNPVIEASDIRIRDEQDVQNLRQAVQQASCIFNTEIEPEHETDYFCDCPIHRYMQRKTNRLGIQELWSKAVVYPGEKSYHDCSQMRLFTKNPYTTGVISPYSFSSSTFYGIQKPDPESHAVFVKQTMKLNAALNAKAQAAVDDQEPTFNIWESSHLDALLSPPKTPDPASAERASRTKIFKFTGLKRALSIKSAEETAVIKIIKGLELRSSILDEERGRWPDESTRQIVGTYQQNMGMARRIADLRAHQPLQYLHLLRAGYFEPIPVAWATLASNPLKFAINAAVGWRGITPAWRGFEDTAEERLYWVLNHRATGAGAWSKTDMISALNMARARMASAVEPPPAYYSADDTCHRQLRFGGYSNQAMPPPFRSVDGPQSHTDDTMILLDVSGSMDFVPMRPVYNQYLITGYARSTQPNNKDLAKAIVRRFIDAMSNHDRNRQGYQLTTFANQATDIGIINHDNFDEVWSEVRFGGQTRVIAGWQKVKEIHFRTHPESATYHPVYGWQAGPLTPKLRLLVLLDGEANDMGEFELDLLGLSWVHVTIFLIGVDGCPHHHRHANELQRISDINPHVSFVDAQGNVPERLVTHEILKRHLGYDLSMAEFEALENLPGHSALPELLS